MRVRSHTALGTASFVAALIVSAVGVAGEPRIVSAIVDLYRVSGMPITIVDEQYVRQPRNDELEAALETAYASGLSGVGTVHVSEYLDAIERHLPVPIEVDDGVIAPAGAPNGAPYRTDGLVRSANIERTTLRDGLRRLLEPLGLDFVVEPNRVRVAAKESIARNPVARIYLPSNNYTTIEDGGVRIGPAFARLGADAPPVNQDTFRQEGKVTLLGRPSITFRTDSEALINIEGMSPAEYLEPKQDRSSDEKEFVLREEKEWMGMNLKVKVAEITGGTARANFVLQTKYIGDRDVLDGTSLRAGRPIFHRREINTEFPVNLGHRIALLTRVADTSDDVFLMLIRLDDLSAHISPEELAEIDPRLVPEANHPQFTVGLTFLHVRGEPDWDWWTRRSDVACQVIDGAGSALGPVALPEDFVLPQRDAAWSALGFTKVRESELISAPRLTDFIDRKRLVAEGKLQNVLKVLTASDTPRFDQPGGPMHPINEAYNGLTGEDRRFTLEDLIGKSVIADITQQYQESNGKIVPLTHGFMALIEVAASDTTNRYAVDQTIAAHNRIDVKRGNTGKDSDTADYYRKKIRTIAEVDVGDTLAYLLPISGDLYLVLLSDFTLAAPKPAVTSQAPSGRGYTVELTNFRSTDDAQ